MDLVLLIYTCTAKEKNEIKSSTNILLLQYTKQLQSFQKYTFSTTCISNRFWCWVNGHYKAMLIGSLATNYVSLKLFAKSHSTKHWCPQILMKPRYPAWCSEVQTFSSESSLLTVMTTALLPGWCHDVYQQAWLHLIHNSELPFLGPVGTRK